MDGPTLRKLRTLPDDLVSLGWEFAPTRSQVSHRAPRYDVLYERPFESESDEHQPGYVFANPFRISVQSWASWEDAYWQAVETMRRIDARRKP